MNALSLLNQHNLRKTNTRLEIIDIFIDSRIALSEYDLELQLKSNCDRATIYRTLKTFLDKGIIHKVLDEKSVVKYAMCKEDDCSASNHNHEHVHFKCQKCGNTICMNGIPIQNLMLPKGFEIAEANLLVIGTCENCNQ